MDIRNTKSRMIVASGFWLLATSSLLAATQEDVLRSISSSVEGGERSGSTILWVMGLVAAVAVVLALLSRQLKREVAPKALNHPGRLLKEVARGMNLRSADLKRLKMLASKQKVSSPLVLILCPSLLKGALQEAKADKKHTGS